MPGLYDAPQLDPAKFVGSSFPITLLRRRFLNDPQRLAPNYDVWRKNMYTNVTPRKIFPRNLLQQSYGRNLGDVVNEANAYWHNLRRTPSFRAKMHGRSIPVTKLPLPGGGSGYIVNYIGEKDPRFRFRLPPTEAAMGLFRGKNKGVSFVESLNPTNYGFMGGSKRVLHAIDLWRRRGLGDVDTNILANVLTHEAGHEAQPTAVGSVGWAKEPLLYLSKPKGFSPIRDRFIQELRQIGLSPEQAQREGDYQGTAAELLNRLGGIRASYEYGTGQKVLSPEDAHKAVDYFLKMQTKPGNFPPWRTRMSPLDFKLYQRLMRDINMRTLMEKILPGTVKAKLAPVDSYA